ncbi:MAG: amidohydrolase family protein [Candidatus Odinarchaeota archaeon]
MTRNGTKQKKEERISTTIFVSKAMVGAELEIQEECLVEINDGMITNIRPDSSPSDAETSFVQCLAIPGFVNSHLHSGDSVAKDVAYGLTVDQSVGKNGIKHQLLAKHHLLIQNAIENTIQELKISGTSAAIEFREGGKKGAADAIAARHSTGFDLKIYGRPISGLEEAEEVLSSCDGFALSATTVYSDEELNVLSSLGKRAGKKIFVHCMETTEEVTLSRKRYGQTDLERAIKPLEADFLVHMTYASENDLMTIAERKTPVTGIICCPRSNAYFGERFPPISWILENAPDMLCLGTDNVMTTPPSVQTELNWTALQLLKEKKAYDCQLLLKLITSNPARLFQLKTGIIEQGHRADFNLIDLNSPNLKFSKDFYKMVVFRLLPVNFVSW